MVDQKLFNTELFTNWLFGLSWWMITSSHLDADFKRPRVKYSLKENLRRCDWLTYWSFVNLITFYSVYIRAKQYCLQHKSVLAGHCIGFDYYWNAARHPLDVLDWLTSQFWRGVKVYWIFVYRSLTLKARNCSDTQVLHWKTGKDSQR